MRPHRSSFFRRYWRHLLWVAAVAAVLISVFVTLFTPVTLLFLFIPLIFMPLAFRWRSRDPDDES